MKSPAFWKKDGAGYSIFVKCPHCGNVDPGGAWLAAHSMFDDIKATCVSSKCGKQFELGKIPNPPKEKS